MSTTPALPDGAPVDDILGVRPGQVFDDVHGILTCRDEGYLVEVAPQWLVRDYREIETRQVIRATDGVPCTGQEIARDMGAMGGRRMCVGGFTGSNFRSVRDASDELHVVFTGMLGDEVAGAVWRTRTYSDDGRPTVEGLEQALIGKYGEPSVREELGGRNWGINRGDILMTWIYDLRGRKVGPDSPMVRQCSTIYPSFQGTQRWSPACSTTVRAAIQKNRSNNLLADSLHTGVMDQKAFYDAGEQFKADMAAAREARRQEAAREAESVATEL